MLKEPFFFSNLLPLKFLLNITNIKQIFPLYHLVSDTIPEHIKHLHNVRNIKTFIDDIDYFLKNFIPVSLFEIIDFVNNKDFPDKNIFHLTFDDGLSEVYDYALPVMIKKGITATIFINSAFVDNKDMSYKFKQSILVGNLKNSSQKQLSKIAEILGERNKNFQIIEDNIKSISYFEKEKLQKIAEVLNIDFEEYLKTRRPYLTTDQIKEMTAKGFTIGGHSIDHPPYPEISETEQYNQTLKSMDFLNLNFKTNYKAFAFPFFDSGLNKEFYRKLFDNEIFDVSFGTSGFMKEPDIRIIQRIWIEEINYKASDFVKTKLIKYMVKRILKRA